MWEDSLHDTEHAEEIGIEHALNRVQINIDDGACKSKLFTLGAYTQGRLMYLDSSTLRC